MRSFLSLLLLSSALALGAGCGPSAAFCPNTDGAVGGACPIFGDDATAPTQDMGTMGICPSGQHLGDNPDGNMTDGLICLCVGTETLPPCN